MLGKKTLLIDADMRKPTINNYFGSTSENGLSEILAGLESEINFESTNIPQLFYMKAGKIPPNPTELLSSDKLDHILDTAQQLYEYIFIDTPPLCMVTDAILFAKKVRGYIFIIKNGKSNTNLIRHTIDNLEQVGANVIGFILNDVNPKSQSIFRTYNVGKYYKYAYSESK
jgi:capsular exopolysaccharide synthesis family protein